MRRLAVVGAVLAALSVVPASAAADATTSDNVAKIVLSGAQTTPDGDVWVGSLTPSFLVEVLLPGASVQCRVDQFDSSSDVPCGTPVTSGCPAAACWNYAPQLSGGFHILTVDYDVPNGIPSNLQFQFNADATPPDTVLHTPPAPDQDLLPSLSASLSPVFDVAIRDDFMGDNDVLQCMISQAGAAPGPFRVCDTSKPLARLRPTGTYVYRVRTVDFLGRPDPTPAQYVFSPTPCRPRVLGRVHSLSQIVAHGLRVRVSCVQPGRFSVQLELPLNETENLHLPSQVLGNRDGQMTRQGQSQVITLHTLRGIPRFLFQLSRLRVDVAAFETANAYGEPGLATDILHR